MLQNKQYELPHLSLLRKSLSNDVQRVRAWLYPLTVRNHCYETIQPPAVPAQQHGN